MGGQKLQHVEGLEGQENCQWLHQILKLQDLLLVAQTTTCVLIQSNILHPVQVIFLCTKQQVKKTQKPLQIQPKSPTQILKELFL